MKLYKVFFMALLAVSIGLASCNKDDDDNPDPGNNNSNGTMTASVDGADFDATLTVQGTLDNGVFVVAGNNGNAQQIQITLNGVSAAGTYQIGGSATNPNMGLYVDGPSAEQSYTTIVGVGSGTAEITELTDTSAKGTFSFNARNTAGDVVNVTDGSFEVSF
jgi:hypothetical protein